MKSLTYDRKQIVILVAVGVAIGVFSFISPGFMFDLLITGAIAYFLLKIKLPDERNFLLKLFLYGVILRAVLLVALHFALASQGRWGYYLQDRAIFLFGDDAYYTLRSWWMAQFFSGHKIPDEAFTNAFSFNGYTAYFYLPAIFYYLFGFSPISAIFLNCLFSVMTGVVYYYMAKEMASTWVAKMTAVLVVFFPSLIIWSIVNLKDSFFIFLTGLAILMFLYALKTRRVSFLVVTILVLIAQFLVRPKLVAANAGLLIFFVLYYYFNGRKVKMKYVFLTILLISVVLIAVKPEVGKIKNAVMRYHKGVTTVGGFNYRLYDDWVYNQGANLNKVTGIDFIKVIPRSWFHFFLEPFPWRVYSVSSLLVAPQMVVWYILIFFAIPGAVVQTRKSPRFSLILIVYFVVMGTSMSMTGGNIGTDFRLRDVLTPIVILFAFAGISRFYKFDLEGPKK